MTTKGLGTYRKLRLDNRVATMETNVNKRLNDLDPIFNEPYFREKSKIVNFHQESITNKNDLQHSLEQHEKGLSFWKKELDMAIEKVDAEKKELEHCLVYIEHNHNHINCLLDSVKRCKDLRLFANVKRVGNPSDETDQALSDEYQILLSSSQTCVRLGKQVSELKRVLDKTELDLIEDLGKKVSSLETTLQCQTFFKSSSISTEQTRSLTLTAIGNVTQDDNFHYRTTNQNIPINLRSMNSGGNWYEEISRRLDNVTEILSQSVQLRNRVKDTFLDNSMKITNAWHAANSKIEADGKVSEAERGKSLSFLTSVAYDLSTTRARISILRGEIEKYARRLEVAIRTAGEYQLKPRSEQLLDEPLNEMKKQCEATAKILQSLQISLEECREQENKLLSVEKELRKSLARATRVFHTHHDQVSGQRRCINHSLPIN